MPNRQLFFSFLLVGTVIFLFYLIVKDYPDKLELDNQIKDIEDKIEVLKKEEERQKDLIVYFNSESYLEKQARLRLNLKKQGEEVVFVYQKDEKNEEQNTGNGDEESWLSKLSNWFKILLLRD